MDGTHGNDLTIVVPLWKRTTNLPRLLASIRATVPAAEVVAVVSPEDDEVQGVAVREPGIDVVCIVPWAGGTTGDYARKINAAYRGTSRPVLFTGADDIEFTDGWYEMARPLLTADLEPRTAPVGTDPIAVGVVGTVDDCNDRTATGALSTHSLVARWYADLGGAWGVPESIYCEEYPHEYVDDELCEVARLRGMYAHAFASVVRHHHPNAGRAEMDETYWRGRARTRESQRIFHRRRRAWAPTGSMPGVTQVSRTRHI